MSGNGLIQALVFGKIAGIAAATEQRGEAQVAVWEKTGIDDYLWRWPVPSVTLSCGRSSLLLCCLRREEELAGSGALVWKMCFFGLNSA